MILAMFARVALDPVPNLLAGAFVELNLMAAFLVAGPLLVLTALLGRRAHDANDGLTIRASETGLPAFSTPHRAVRRRASFSPAAIPGCR